MTFNKNKKIIAVVLLAIFLSINFASAAVPNTLNEQGLQQGGVLYSLAYIGAHLVSWGGQLVNWSLNLNSKLMDSHVIKIGWPVARDIANLGFVLAIILIAFVTILRIETYNTKQLLWRLIAAALLVNFSLVIAGVFIDFSGVITDFFIRKTADPNQLASVIANSLQAQNILAKGPDMTAMETLTGLVSGWGKGVLQFTTDLFFVLFFTGLSAITMLGLAAMLYIRYLILTILLTLMPVAWLLWIWPDTQGNWTNWWSEFFRWIWFAPAISFFVYLAISIVNASAKCKIPITDTATQNFCNSINLGASFGAQTFSFTDAGQTIGQMLSVIGILIGGMITADKMGIAGAGMTISAAKGFKNIVTGAITGGAIGVSGIGAGGWLRTRALTAGADPTKEKESYAQRVGSFLSRGSLLGIPVPGAKTLGGKINQLATATHENISDYQKTNLSKLSDDAVAARAGSSTAFINPIETAALANEIAKRGITGGTKNYPISDDRLKDFLGAARKFGSEKEILKNRPELAAHLIPDEDKKSAPKRVAAIKKILDGMKLKQTLDIATESLENAEVMLGLGLDRITEIAKNGSDGDKIALITALKKAEELIGKIDDSAEKSRFQTLLNERTAHITQNVVFHPFLAGVKIPKPAKFEGEGTA